MAAVIMAILLTAQGCLLNMIGGSFDGSPAEMRSKISAGAKELIQRAFQDVDPKRLRDYHVHILGLGHGGTGMFANPKMQTWWRLPSYIKFRVYTSGAQITDFSRADQQYEERLVDLIRHARSPENPGGKYHVLAFDKTHTREGKVDLEHTQFHVPNTVPFRLAKKYPDIFLPTISVHPYRKDALVELEKWAKRGGKVVKWLPNAMNIHPADDRLKPYYEMMKKYNLVLQTHAGHEAAVEADHAQSFGNPLHVRLPLNMGVKVVIAHAASLGTNVDLDDPEKKIVSGFDLFMRMFTNKKYEGLLFGEISAMTQANRLPTPLATLLKRKDLHHRLVNGSDYPLPSINVVIRTGALESYGFITSQEREYLNEIYAYNPLLFDYVVKRTIRAPGTKIGFSPSVFMENPAL